MVTTLIALASLPALAGDTVTVTIGDETAEIDALGISPVGLSAKVSSVTSATLSYTGVPTVKILDAIAEVGGSTVPMSDLTLLPSGDGWIDGQTVYTRTAGGVQIVPCNDASEVGILIAADEASMADTVSTTGTATVVIDGVSQTYGTTTLAGDRSGLDITADYTAHGAITCRVIAALGKETRIDTERPCDDIGVVHGDGLSYKHFNTDYHESDCSSYWTWGGFVFNFVDHCQWQ